MAAGAWVFTTAARTKILDGTFASGSSWKVAIYLSTSNLTTASTTYAGVTNESGTTNTGYATGGVAVTATLTGTTSVTWTFATNPSWTAGSANLVGKWAALYKVAGDVFCFCLLDSGGADVTTTNGNTFTVDSDGTPGPVLTLA